MLRTNKIFNKTATNNISFQEAHSKIQTSFLSSCPSWIILMVSGLLFIQTNPLSAMETPDISQKSKSTGGQPKVPKTEFYQDAAHPLTQDFLKKRDLSKRLQQIQPYILDAKEKIVKNEINQINFNKTDLKEILKCLGCNSELRQALKDVLHDELSIFSYELRDINGGRSGNKVRTAFCNGQDLIAIKTFKNKEKGLQELLHSLIALALNPHPEKLKMARIYDAFHGPEDGLSIIMEAAKGRAIHQFLSTDLSKHVIDACAEYFAAFHIQNYGKNVNNIDGKEFIKHASEPYHTLHLNLLTEEEKEGFDLLNLSIGTRVLEPDEKVTSSNIIKLLETTEKQIQFKKLVNKSCETFAKNCGYILRNEKPYPRTRTHGDAQKDNFLYNGSDDLKDANGSAIRMDSLQRVIMIDFESIGKTIGKIGDLAEDVGRFVGSLWDLAAELPNTEPANDIISNLQEQFIRTYLYKIRKSNIFSSEKDKKIFEKIFAENCNFYKLRFYRAVFNTEKDKTIKLQILKSWIKEAAELLGPIQKNLQPDFFPDKLDLRPWGAVDMGTRHCHLPDPVEDFITSAAKDSETSYLTSLYETLHSTGTATLSSSAAIAGMGGIGKTSLALAYAHEALRNNAYDLIFWLPSGTELSLLKGYRNLLLEMGVSEDRGFPIKNIEDERIIELVKQHVPKKGPSLLIYDNVSDPDFLNDKVPKENAHILITSRCNQGWKKLLSLEVFRPEDSIKYLCKVTGFKESDDKDNIVQALAAELGHFPLALAHAAHYLKLVGGEYISAIHFTDYLGGLKTLTSDYFEEKKNDFTEDKSKITYEHLVSKTLRMSEKYLTKKGIFDLAKEFLAYCSYLDGDSIEEEIFLEHWPDKSQDAQKIKEVLKTTTSLSLIKKAKEKPSFSIHQLLQVVIRDEIEEKEKSEYRKTILNVSFLLEKTFERNFYQNKKIDSFLNENVPHIAQFLNHSKKLYIKYFENINKLISLLNCLNIIPQKTQKPLLLLPEEMNYIQWIGIISQSIKINSIEEINLNFWSNKNLETQYKENLSRKLLKSIEELNTNFLPSDGPPKGLKEIIKHSLPAIQFGLSYVYGSGSYKIKNEKEAYKWCKKSADQEYAPAEFTLAVMYKNGEGVCIDRKEAEKYYKKVANKGYAAAQYELAIMHMKNGDYKLAVDYYTLAANQGYALAQNQLGQLYRLGQEVAQNFRLALHYFTLSADQENEDAQNQLGFMYMTGLGVERNFSLALHYFALSADQENALAQNQLGFMYMTGLGTPQDAEKALALYKKAADQGNKEALASFLRLKASKNDKEWLAAAAKYGVEKAREKYVNNQTTEKMSFQ